MLGGQRGEKAWRGTNYQNGGGDGRKGKGRSEIGEEASDRRGEGKRAKSERINWLKGSGITPQRR